MVVGRWYEACCLATSYASVETHDPESHAFDRKYLLRVNRSCCRTGEARNNCCAPSCCCSEAIYDIMDPAGGDGSGRMPSGWFRLRRVPWLRDVKCRLDWGGG